MSYDLKKFFSSDTNDIVIFDVKIKSWLSFVGSSFFSDQQQLLHNCVKHCNKWGHWNKMDSF